MHRFLLSELVLEKLLEMIHYLIPLCNKIPKTTNKLGAKIGLEKMYVPERKILSAVKFFEL